MSVQFDPFSRIIGFNYRNEPSRFRAAAHNVLTKKENGVGAKLYSKFGVTQNRNKKIFYKKGSFRGPKTKKNRAFAKFQAQQENLVRMRGEDPVRWAKEFHERVNNNVYLNNNETISNNNNNNNNLQTPNTRSLCKKVCNAVGRCFCSRKGGKTMRKRKQS